MPSQELVQRLDGFIEKMKEPYKKVEDVPEKETERIYGLYVAPIFGMEESLRDRVLQVMEESHQENANHGKIRQWSRLCVGLACLLKTDEKEPYDMSEAADIIVRLSRWHHSDGKFYQSFVPWAQKITGLLYGGIGNLYGSIHGKIMEGNDQ